MQATQAQSVQILKLSSWSSTEVQLYCKLLNMQASESDTARWYKHEWETTAHQAESWAADDAIPKPSSLYREHPTGLAAIMP